MIIQQASVQLGQTLYEQNQFLQQDKLSMNAVNNNTNTLPSQRLILEQKDTFEFEHRQKQQYKSTTDVRQGDKETVIRQDQTSAEMLKLSLVGEQAVIATHQAFPVDQNEQLDVSGIAEVSLFKKLTLKSEETSSFLANGMVKLADGREIDFNLFASFESQTEINAETQASLTLARMQDPLVINFGTETTTLTDQYFEFDLDSDESRENYAKLGYGSGYLVFDLNGDGRVNDGKELFGTVSGNGFVDLAKYDEDGNGWIDEQDDIFDKLKLWTDQSDSTQLVSIAEKGVGAIFLGHVEQGQTLRSSQGEQLGKVAAAGVVLMENGEVKTAQSIDLAERKRVEDINVVSGYQQKMQSLAEVFNEMQARKEALTLRFSGTTQQSWEQQRISFGERSDWRSAQEEVRNFFDELRERIEKMIEQRKAVLEKINQRYTV